MKHAIFITLVCSVLGACAGIGADNPPRPDSGNTEKVTMDDLNRLQGDNWQGTLSYLNYGSDKRSTIPVKATIKVLDKNGLLYAIQYPGEEQYNVKERLKLSSDGTRIDGYSITNREQAADGTLVLTTEGKGRDDNRPAQIQIIYSVAADRFSIRKNVRFTNEEAYLNRNEYSFLR